MGGWRDKRKGEKPGYFSFFLSDSYVILGGGSIPQKFLDHAVTLSIRRQTHRGSGFYQHPWHLCSGHITSSLRLSIPWVIMISLCGRSLGFFTIQHLASHLYHIHVNKFLHCNIQGSFSFHGSP